MAFNQLSESFMEIPYGSLMIPSEPFARTNNTTVYKGKYKKIDVAVKNSRTFSKKELTHHACLSHPNIVQLVGAVTRDHRNMIVMEFAKEGSLSDRLRSGEPIPVNLAYSWSNDAVAAIQYLHENSIIHQDIKPANFLVFPTGLKACDFGFARALEDGTTITSQVGGTMRYMPPERFQKSPLVSTKCDIYSLMIVIVEIMTGKRHFDGISDYELTRRKLVPSPPTSIPDDWPDELKTLCYLCWQNDHRDRPHINQVREIMLSITKEQQSFHVKKMADIKSTQMATGYNHKLVTILTQPSENFQLVVKGTSYTKFHRRCKRLPIKCLGTGFLAQKHLISNSSLGKAQLICQYSGGLLIAKRKKNGNTKITRLNNDGTELKKFYLTYKDTSRTQQYVSSIATDSMGNIYAMCRQMTSSLSASMIQTQRARFQFGEQMGELLREEDNGWFCLKYNSEGMLVKKIFTSHGFREQHARPMLKIHKDIIYVNSWVHTGVVEKFKIYGQYVETLALGGIKDITIDPSGIIVGLSNKTVVLFDEHGKLLEEFEHKIADTPVVHQHVAINQRHVLVANKSKTQVFKVL
ncbi:calcium-dependent protein kinase 3-like [Anneissia japonica]|uniref:calcium-dependent protein kinase 3-like n=1 Tax=Anneissia japonica TaxID=1529436 RepID=UPI0014259FB4|nr:calcium-dependent protein kinase 3-like [Anneissia japonica]